MDDVKTPSTKRSANSNLLKWALLAAFLVAAILTAILTFYAVRDFVASWKITSLPGVALTGATSTPNEAGVVINDPQEPLQPADGPTPPEWDGASRVTVLAMGLDYRDWSSGEGPARTDTMMLLTIDPINRTAGMLSIPRDLWVAIPGFDYDRINTAYRTGEAYKLPGGGPELAMQTVENLLGVPIDYYAQVDFFAFVRFIDEIGGVKIDVPEKIQIDPLGDNNTKTLKPGRQTLPGDLALAYARARKNAGDDFGRAERQQQVILAIRNQILSFNMLPTLMTKAPALYQELSSGIHTNLSLDQALQLAWLASQIPEDQIKKGVIAPPDMVTLAKTNDGDDVLKPIMDKIRILRDEIFTDSGPVSPAATSADAAGLMKEEGAKISLLNGSSTAGIAAKTSEYLQAQGATNISTGNAEQLYNTTTIIDYKGRPYTVKYLVELMKIPANQIYSRYDPTKAEDVVVILGEDWARSNPIP